jgi:hypothetical protein
MPLERWIRLLAGSFIIASVALAYWQSSYWLFFTLFVGFNLFQSALTGFCPAEMILSRLGVGGARSCERSAEGPLARGHR